MSRDDHLDQAPTVRIQFRHTRYAIEVVSAVSTTGALFCAVSFPHSLSDGQLQLAYACLTDDIINAGYQVAAHFRQELDGVVA